MVRETILVTGMATIIGIILNFRIRMCSVFYLISSYGYSIFTYVHGMNPNLIRQLPNQLFQKHTALTKFN